MNTKYKILNTKYKRGYTFIELIVVVLIFSIVSSVALFNFSDFSTNIYLQNTTSDIALQIKEAQSDAIAGKLNDTILFLGEENYKPAYGIHFNISSKSDSFKKFTDLDKSRFYDGGSGNCDGSDPECLREFKINNFITISHICVRRATNPSVCDDISNTLDISFERPFPDAIIVADGSTDVIYTAEIFVISSKQKERKVIVNTLGGIVTENVQ